jgi:N-acetylmuramoyl-L-alanine amidase
MKKRLIALFIMICLTAATLVSASALSVVVDSRPVAVETMVSNNTTYVPLRAAAQMLSPDAKITWENNQGVVRTPELTLTAKPGSLYVNANGRMLFAAYGVKAENGSLMIPIRVLAKAMNASVGWDGERGQITLQSGSGAIPSGDSFYDDDAVYWLSRIIHAESRSEPLKGKIAVGNVILNRVRDPGFPDTIYGVIFDSRWGGQFQPVKNGAINNTPSADSILAAKLCLDGASVAGSSLFFLNPAISSNFWMMQNKSHVTTIGNHQFYV